MGSTSLSTGSIYEHDAYLTASAEHVGASLELVGVDGAAMPLLRYPDSSRRTVYGLPRPLGATSADRVADLASKVAAEAGPLTAILSPLEPGPMLAAALCDHGAELEGLRPICIAELGSADPGNHFDKRARRAVATAHKRGAQVELGPLEPWFGAFYRAAMAKLDADPVYLFSDEYFDALGALGHYVVAVEDHAGIAAAALFLHDEREAYYHLGGRRNDPDVVVGAMSVALGEGVREAWRRGCGVAVLGGGRSDAQDDSLFTFKRQLAPVVMPRPSIRLAGGVR
jgi:hypothetical protein